MQVSHMHSKDDAYLHLDLLSKSLLAKKRRIRNLLYLRDLRKFNCEELYVEGSLSAYPPGALN